MTTSMIVALLRKFRQLETGIDIVEACACFEEQLKLPSNDKYVIQLKRVMLVRYWFSYLSEAEATVLRLHLVDGISWVRLSSLIRNERKYDIPYDPRSLQRLQRQALDKIEKLMAVFNKELDYLAVDASLDA